MADAPPVLRTLQVVFGVEAGRLVVRVGGRENFIARVDAPHRAPIVMDELERWIVYRIGNAAYELSDRLRSPALAVGPSADPSRSVESR